MLISAIMSAAIECDPFGNRCFSKRRAVNRIDALIALAMAVRAATGNATAASGRSAYAFTQEVADLLDNFRVPVVA